MEPDNYISKGNNFAILWIIGGIFSFCGLLVYMSNAHNSSVAQPNTVSTANTSTNVPVASTSKPVPQIKTWNTLQEFQEELIREGYYLGPKGADGVYGSYTQRAWQQCYQKGSCIQQAPSDEYVVPSAEEYVDPNALSPSVPGGSDIIPGDGYGAISPRTGLPRTDYVHGYTKQNGTVVQPYYRSHK